ncbi:hypothetical protein BOX37_29975 [Nocardia mangyaensis]|uniref:Transposase (putative) YhgA-like domain-containing protein n=1 Tax=Nocardia mangyaensis TaxID=2213200 RepID=A0A1J0VZM4_9NOCA|nr:Rpn family recombination-promoting nuclease/putative transposase [Nocardia mangyaensis]APE37454.1 hypothetical protein BOX37_29975 [Nocardia mangyaensis]
MADSAPKPHDAFFRHMLRRPADAASQLRPMLPAEIADRLDWANLEPQSGSFVSKHLRATYSDLLFRTRLDGCDAYLYLLLEHQSRTDRFMALRMLDYLVAIWTHYLRDHPKATTLPPIVPLVVHASTRQEAWDAPVEVADLIGIDPAARAALGPHLPRLQVAVLTYIVSVGDTPSADLQPFIDQLGPEAKEAFVTTAEQLRAEGEARGEARGRSAMLREILVEQLTLKFGPLTAEITSRVHSAEQEQLREWSARILTAASLDDMRIR